MTCVAGDHTYHSTRECIGNGLVFSFRNAYTDKRSSESQEVKCLGVGTIRSGADNDCRSSKPPSGSLYCFRKPLVIEFCNIEEHLSTTFLDELLFATMVYTDDAVGHSSRPYLGGKMPLRSQVSKDKVKKRGLTNKAPASAGYRILVSSKP